MIAHAEFLKMRLTDFVPADQVRTLQDWEFERTRWVGEALGFTEFLRPATAPEELHCLTLDLQEFSAAGEVLERIGLPLERGMSAETVENVLGQAYNRSVWPNGRRSLSFNVAASDRYFVDCAFSDQGLCYLVVMIPRPGCPEDYRENP